ncbi:MAG: glycoside hydrolase family 26 protein [Planctomycetota bacterium]|jgi:hypothetical protein
MRNLVVGAAVLLTAWAPCSAGEAAQGRAEGTYAPRTTLVAPADGVYLAAFPDLGGGEDEVSVEKIREFEGLVGKPTAWVYFSNNWYDEIAFPRKDVDTIHAAGSVPFIRLMARSRGRRGGADPVYSMQAIIDGRFDKDLAQWARDARDVAEPLLAEFGVEVNGSWFPWNGMWHGAGETGGYGDPDYPDGPERFRDAYRHIIDICRTEGANNIVWFFHVDASTSPDEPWNAMANYYPGDDYIDWLGISVYGSQRPGREWLTFTGKLDRAYAEFAAISPGKPLAVIEYGVCEDPASGNKAEWIRDALNAVKEGRYPRIKALSYWHESWGEGERRSDLRLDSSPAAMNAYREIVADDFFVPRLRFDIRIETTPSPPASP